MKGSYITPSNGRRFLADVNCALQAESLMTLKESMTSKFEAQPRPVDWLEFNVVNQGKDG